MNCLHVSFNGAQLHLYVGLKQTNSPKATNILRLTVTHRLRNSVFFLFIHQNALCALKAVDTIGNYSK